MITNRFGKAGIAIGITILFCGLSFTPCTGDPLDDYDLPDYRAIIFSPFPDQPFFAEADELFNRALISGGWEEENIIRLLYEDASHENLIENLQYLASVDDCYDTTLICIFSHGSQGFFVDHGDNNVYYSELDSLLDQLHSAGIGVIIEACNSGSAIPVLSHEGRVIATSTNADYDGNGGYGRAIALGFDGFGDFCPDYGNNNGVTSIEEAYNWFIYNYPDDPSLIDDRYSGQLHITFQNWDNGRKDEITNHTYIFVPYQTVQKTNTNDFQVAQSFRPQYNYLTKVRLFISKYGDITSPIEVSIRWRLNGIDLTSIVLYPNEIGSFENYVTFDFPDISVIPNFTYYIVCRATQIDTIATHYYKIFSCSHNDGSCYPYGSSWQHNGGSPWQEVSNVDLEFVTYGESIGYSFPPYVPKRPAGSVFVIPGEESNYSISTEDVDGNNIYYLIDWDDQQSGQWIGPYTSGTIVQCLPSWTQSGIYHIRVKAKDVFNQESDWSDNLTVLYTHPPETPEIYGESIGKVGQNLPYTFSSTDPDNESVYYQIDWGDSSSSGIWLGPYPSGQQIIQSHTWQTPGKYVIKCKAKDIYGVQSDWGLFNVKIT